MNKILLRIHIKTLLKEELLEWIYNTIKELKTNTKFSYIDDTNTNTNIKNLNEIVYCFSTDVDNVYKIGKTKNNPKIRKSTLQTSCVNDIVVLYETKTSNCTQLEKLIHYTLSNYRIANREHFKCNLECIKYVMDKCGNIIKSNEEWENHYLECKNLIVSCIFCSS